MAVAKQQLQIPQAASDISSPSDGQGMPCTNNAMSSQWFRFLNQLVNYVVPSKGAVFYQGSNAPAGWTIITISGVTLPSGWVIIQKN